MAISTNNFPMLEAWAGEVVQETTGTFGAFVRGAIHEDFAPQGDAEKILCYKSVGPMDIIPLGGEVPEYKSESTEKLLQVITLGQKRFVLNREANGTYPGALKQRSVELSVAYDKRMDIELYNDIKLATTAGKQFVDAAGATVPTGFTKRLVSTMMSRLKIEARGQKKVLVVNQFDMAEIRAMDGFHTIQGNGIQAIDTVFGIEIVESDLVLEGEVVLYVTGAFKVKYAKEDLIIKLKENLDRLRTDVYGFGDAIVGVYDEEMVVRGSFVPFGSVDEVVTVPAG